MCLAPAGPPLRGVPIRSRRIWSNQGVRTRSAHSTNSPGTLSRCQGNWRRGRDSNPRTREGQRFSRPPLSATQPPLHIRSSILLPTLPVSAGTRLIPPLYSGHPCPPPYGSTPQAALIKTDPVGFVGHSATSPLPPPNTLPFRSRGRIPWAPDSRLYGPAVEKSDGYIGRETGWSRRRSPRRRIPVTAASTPWRCNPAARERRRCGSSQRSWRGIPAPRQCPTPWLPSTGIPATRKGAQAWGRVEETVATRASTGCCGNRAGADHRPGSCGSGYRSDLASQYQERTLTLPSGASTQRDPS